MKLLVHLVPQISTRYKIDSKQSVTSCSCGIVNIVDMETGSFWNFMFSLLLKLGWCMVLAV